MKKCPYFRDIHIINFEVVRFNQESTLALMCTDLEQVVESFDSNEMSAYVLFIV